MTIRILVTGSREWDDRETLWAELDKVCAHFGVDIVIVHGACYPKVRHDGTRPAVSADWLAHMWCVERGIPDEPHPAEWDKHGPAAGPIRNQSTVDLGPYKLTLAFPLKGNGTWDCIKRANRAGIAVRIVPRKAR